MAELIPLQYRLRVAQRQQFSNWLFIGAIILMFAGAALAYTFAWERQRCSEYETLHDEFKTKSVIIGRSQQLRAARNTLASRMQKIQQLMDDKVLLSLLRNISESFSGNDSLEYIQIDARGSSSKDASSKTDTTDGPYVVRITGITNNSSTLAELMTRLGKNSTPAMNVVLETSRREAYLDGQVMRFQIVCEKPENKGT